MHKDLNENINIDIAIKKLETIEFSEKNNEFKKIEFSNISTKETIAVSSETDESIASNKNKKENTIKEELKKDQKDQNIDICFLSKAKEKKNKKEGKRELRYENYKSEFLTKKNSMNIKAPKIPNNYNHIFNIDKIINQVNKGENEYINQILEEKNIKNKEYKKLPVISHDKLMHVITSENIYNNNTKREKYNKISITERFKHKFLTTLYIFPKK